jgi:bifunctional DNA-binding transcriptional regulator/antitoxin component of YhaV-PrlF toxin-antitoxin module
MATFAKLAISVSTEGSVELPVSIRRRRGWIAGTQLIVEDTADGVLLKAATLFVRTSPKDVFGSLKVRGKPKTLKQMKVGTKARGS